MNTPEPCAGGEAWQCVDPETGQWEEIYLCDINPNDRASWTWYYNYKGNKKGVQTIKIISEWLTDSQMNILVKLPNNPNKYKIVLNKGSRDLVMEKVEGNMSIGYYRHYTRIH